MLQNLSFKRALTGISVLTSITLGLLLVLLVKDDLSRLSHTEHDNKMVSLAYGADQIAHNFAVERGLSAGYIGSGNQDTLQKLSAQRTKADTTITAFSQQPMPPTISKTFGGDDRKSK